MGNLTCHSSGKVMSAATTSHTPSHQDRADFHTTARARSTAFPPRLLKNQRAGVSISPSANALVPSKEDGEGACTPSSSGQLGWRCAGPKPQASWLWSPKTSRLRRKCRARPTLPAPAALALKEGRREPQPQPCPGHLRLSLLLEQRPFCRLMPLARPGSPSHQKVRCCGFAVRALTLLGN